MVEQNSSKQQDLPEPFCAKCGGRVELRIPPGDERKRRVCTACDGIFYDNPQILVGSVATRDESILLCRRAIPPRRGYWTLPAGYMEKEESAEEGACREAWEEARAKLKIDALLAVYSLPHISQVQLLFAATVQNEDIACGHESEEVEFFSHQTIPWDRLAFPTVKWALMYFENVRREKSFTPEVRTRRPDGG